MTKSPLERAEEIISKFDHSKEFDDDSLQTVKIVTARTHILVKSIASAFSEIEEEARLSERERMVGEVERELAGNSKMCGKMISTPQLSCFCDRCYERHDNRASVLAVLRGGGKADPAG